MDRTIDANINRVSEGFRVIEDILRFEFNNKDISEKLKLFRHFIREKFATEFYKTDLKIEKRDSVNDVGKEYSSSETNRKDIYDVLKANIYRVCEGLRVLEELSKLNENLFPFIVQLKSIRYEMYEIEKSILERLIN